MKNAPSWEQRLLFFTVVLIAAPLTAQTPIQWNESRYNPTILNWTDSANWLGGVSPSENEEALVLFRTTSSVNNQFYDVVLDIEGPEQVLRGGLHFDVVGNALRTVALDLNGKRLVIDGEKLVISGTASTARTAVRFYDGTLQLGTTENSASLRLGIEHANANETFTVEFGDSSVLDTYNTRDILVSAVDFSESYADWDSNRARRYILDLSQATLRSQEQLGALAATGKLAVGESAHRLPHASIGGETQGRLVLGEVSLVQSADLVVGEQQRRSSNGSLNGGNAVVRNVTGILGFANETYSTPIELKVQDSLRIGVGDYANGGIHKRQMVTEIDDDDNEILVEVLSDAPAMNVTVGSEAQRGIILVGYKNQSHGGGQYAELDNGVTSGSFVTQGGSFNAWLTELRIGQNTETREGGSTTGILGFGNSELGVLDIDGDAIIGQGLRAVGTLSLKSGLARSNDLIVGDTSGTEEVSLLSLNGTTWEVENVLLVGVNGRVEIAVDGTSSGLDFLLDDSSSLLIQEGGVIDVRFDQAPDVGHLWGLRMSGDHKDYLESFLGEGLVASGVFGESAIVFTDGGYTYYGITAIPEVSTISLLMLTAGGILWIRLRKPSTHT